MLFLLGLGRCEDSSVQCILLSPEMCLLLKLTDEKHHINVFIVKYSQYSHQDIFCLFVFLFLFSGESS